MQQAWYVRYQQLILQELKQLKELLVAGLAQPRLATWQLPGAETPSSVLAAVVLMLGDAQLIDELLRLPHQFWQMTGANVPNALVDISQLASFGGTLARMSPAAAGIVGQWLEGMKGRLEHLTRGLPESVVGVTSSCACAGGSALYIPVAMHMRGMIAYNTLVLGGVVSPHTRQKAREHADDVAISYSLHACTQITQLLAALAAASEKDLSEPHLLGMIELPAGESNRRHRFTWRVTRF